MKELYRAISSNDNEQPIEVDLTDMTALERYTALTDLKAQIVGTGYTIMYHLCTHPTATGCGCSEYEAT